LQQPFYFKATQNTPVPKVELTSSRSVYTSSI
jgi:hypothetical protein